MADRRSRRRRGWRVSGFTAITIILGFWFAGLLVFINVLPTSVADPETKTDVIVVLTGGAKRLETGLTLLANRRAEKLFVSGVYRGVDVARILAIYQRKPEEFTCCVELGYSAASTSGNALETAERVRKQGYRSVRLVTANYHMPRSLLEFRHRMPNIDVYPHAVFPDRFKRENWWA